MKTKHDFPPRNPLTRYHPAFAYSIALVLALTLYACSISTPYNGEYINRDYPGSKLTIKGGQVVLSEGKGLKTTTIIGKVSKLSTGEFEVEWKVTDPNAIKKSRFVPETSGSNLAALHEYPLDGLVADVEVVYIPVAAYAQGIFIASKGETMSATFNLVSKTVSVILPDGEHFTLPQALSASGARYSDGTNTFWEHQGGAIFEINGRQVFEGLLRGD
jgi:hypothetical protein